MAACSTLNFSDMSLIGRKKRCDVVEKRDQRAQRQRAAAARMPPPYQMMSADASALTASTAG